MDELKWARNVLGVHSQATHVQVREAFRSAAKIHHPDAGGSAERFGQLRRAYQLTVEASTSSKRRRQNTYRLDVEPTFQHYPDSTRRAFARPAPVRSFAEILARQMGYA